MRSTGLGSIAWPAAALAAGILVVVLVVELREDPRPPQGGSRAPEDAPGRAPDDPPARAPGDPARSGPLPALPAPLRDGAEIGGRVADLPADLLASARVWLVDDRERTRVVPLDSSGGFRIAEIPPGRSFDLHLGFGEQDPETILLADTTLGPAETREVTLRVLDRFFLAVLVEDAAGRPIPGVKSTVVPQGGDFTDPDVAVRATTGADGRLVLSEPIQPVDRALSLVLEKVEDGYLLEQRAVRAPPGGVLRYRVRLERGRRIAGTVLGPEGEPIAGAQVRIEEHYENPGEGDRLPNWGLVRTDSKGRFADDAFRPGNYRIVARGDVGGRPFLAVEERVAAGREDVAIRFAGFGSMSLRFRDDRTDAPVPVMNGVVQRVFARTAEKEDFEDWAYFSGKGVVEVKDLPAGEYRVCVNHRGYQPVFGDVLRIAAGERLGPVVYRLRRSERR